MSQTLLVVDSDLQDAERLAEPFGSRGWNVLLAQPDAPDIVERIAEDKPLAAVLCLTCSDPDLLEGLATRVQADSRVLRPLMVFVGGDGELVSRLKPRIPVGVFVREDELPWVLKHLGFRF